MWSSFMDKWDWGALKRFHRIRQSTLSKPLELLHCFWQRNVRLNWGFLTLFKAIEKQENFLSCELQWLYQNLRNNIPTCKYVNPLFYRRWSPLRPFREPDHGIWKEKASILEDLLPLWCWRNQVYTSPPVIIAHQHSCSTTISLKCITW